MLAHWWSFSMRNVSKACYKLLLAFLLYLLFGWEYFYLKVINSCYSFFMCFSNYTVQGRWGRLPQRHPGKNSSPPKAGGWAELWGVTGHAGQETLKKKTNTHTKKTYNSYETFLPSSDWGAGEREETDIGHHDGYAWVISWAWSWASAAPILGRFWGTGDVSGVVGHCAAPARGFQVLFGWEVFLIC